MFCAFLIADCRNQSSPWSQGEKEQTPFERQKPTVTVITVQLLITRLTSGHAQKRKEKGEQSLHALLLLLLLLLLLSFGSTVEPGVKFEIYAQKERKKIALPIENLRSKRKSRFRIFRRDKPNFEMYRRNVLLQATFHILLTFVSADKAPASPIHAEYS